MTKTQIRRFGKNLKEWAYSQAGDRLLCSHDCTDGACSWVAGGCVPLALALLEVLEGSELYAVWVKQEAPPWFRGRTMPTHQLPHHVGVMLDGLFIDGLGARLPRSVERWWASELETPKVAPVTTQSAIDIISDPPKIRDPLIDNLVGILVPILDGILLKSL